MLDDSTVARLTEALVGTDNYAEQLGWDNPPVLLGLFLRDTRQQFVTEVKAFPVNPDMWRLADPHHPGQRLSPAVVLAALVKVIGDPTTRPHLATWLRRNGRRFVGAAFICEAYQTPLYPGYQNGDLNTVPAMAETEVRALTALDTDHRLYQIIRTRGHDEPSTTVHDTLPPLFTETTIGGALYHLVNLARDLQAEHHNGAQP